jgi:hypothetical protein
MLRHVALVRTNISEERWFLQDPHGVTSQKTAFFDLGNGGGTFKMVFK